jgi:hypothetical protein
MEDGGRLAPMAAELVDRLAILVAVCGYSFLLRGLKFFFLFFVLGGGIP